MTTRRAAARLAVELALLDAFAAMGMDTTLQRARVVFARVEYEETRNS